MFRASAVVALTAVLLALAACDVRVDAPPVVEKRTIVKEKPAEVQIKVEDKK